MKRTELRDLIWRELANPPACADGPECSYCPAEAVTDALVEAGVVAVSVPHPDYRADPSTAEGARCVCGGIRYWHAEPPYGCVDCACTEFRDAR